MTISDRLQAIEPSVTLAVNAHATALKEQGQDIINLSVGEPDFDTPEPIKQAAQAAMQAGFTKYTAADGIADLKQAIIEKLARDQRLTYQPKQVIVSNGAKQCLYNLCQSILNPGDEAVIIAPYWVSYPAMITMAGATTVVVKTDQTTHFQASAAALEAAITSKTRLVILNSPSNPTGVCYSAEALAPLLRVIEKHPQIILASDDIYEYILWQKDFVHPLELAPALYDRTIIINGVSKSHAMTGWRMGYAAGPTDIIQAMKKIQSQSTGNPNAIAQKATIAALNMPRTALQPMFDAFKRRQHRLLAGLQAIDSVDAMPADGTFYLFPNVARAIEKLGLKDDIAFATYLLDQAKVATVPGSGFGAPGYIRLSYAIDDTRLATAIERIQKVLA